MEFQALQRLSSPLLTTLCLVLTTSWGTAAFLQETPDGSATTQQTAERFREGTKFEKVNGSFRVAVDRVEFHPAQGGASLVVLENLALERVVDELTGDLELAWQVDGRITEYHGRNYLLLDRAYVRTARDR
jgi:hypothetical protein